jgi:uncharacterized membrane protein
MALTNPLTHFIWRFDSAGYHREFGMTFIYLAALLYYVMAIVVMVNSWSILSEKRRRALIFFVIMVAAGIIIQLVDKALRVEVLTEILGLSGVMMSIENEDERIYSGTRFYNRSALGLDIGGCLMHNRKMSLIMIHINNHDIINRLVDNRENNVIIGILYNIISYPR